MFDVLGPVKSVKLKNSVDNYGLSCAVKLEPFVVIYTFISVVTYVYINKYCLLSSLCIMLSGGINKKRAWKTFKRGSQLTGKIHRGSGMVPKGSSAPACLAHELLS